MAVGSAAFMRKLGYANAFGETVLAEIDKDIRRHAVTAATALVVAVGKRFAGVVAVIVAFGVAVLLRLAGVGAGGG